MKANSENASLTGGSPYSRDLATADIRTYEPDKNPTDQYVFISYKSDDWPIVLDEIVRTLVNDYGVKVYFDKNFAHDNQPWIDNMKRAIDSQTCRGILSFVSRNYYYSYACLMELMESRTNRCKRRHKYYLPIFPIIIDGTNYAKDQDKMINAARVNIPEWNQYRTLVQELTQNHELDSETDLSDAIRVLADNTDMITKSDIASAIYYIIDAGNIGKGESGAKAYFRDYDRSPTFYQNLVDALKRECSDEIFNEKLKGTCSSSHQPKPDRSVQSAQTGQPANQSSTGLTVGAVRTLFSDPENASRFRSVRESFGKEVRGGKGAIDYVMATLLGGCNQITTHSPSCQINYYTQAVAKQDKASDEGSLGASWSWSTACRHLLGIKGSGQIPKSIDVLLQQIPGETTLAAIRECFESQPNATEEMLVQNVDNPYLTKDNQKVLAALDKIEAFLADAL